MPAPLWVLCGETGKKGKPGWAWVACTPRVGEEGTAVGEGSGPAEWELQDPGNRPLRAPACRLPVPAPRGTMGCLLGPGQELRVGVGEGRPGEEEGRLARSRPAGQSLRRACWPAPLGLSLLSQPAPPEGRQRELGQLAEEAWALGTLFHFPLPPARPCVNIPSPAGTGVPQAQEEALGNSKAAHPLPRRSKDPGSGRAWGHFQAAGTTPSELRGVSAPFLGLFGSN